MAKCPNIPTRTDIKVVHILRESLRMEDCLQVINERVDREGRNISLSKSRKKLGSCSRSVHVKTFRRFPMTTYLKRKRKRQVLSDKFWTEIMNSGGQIQVGALKCSTLIPSWSLSPLLSVKKPLPLQPPVDAPSPYPTASTLQTQWFSCSGHWVDQMSLL